MGQAKRLMTLKGIRFLPVVVDLPLPAAAAAAAATPSPPPPPLDGAATSTAPLAGRPSNGGGNNADWKVAPARISSSGASDGTPAGVPQPPPPPPQPPQAIVGVLSRESVRIAGRLMETERAIRDRPPPTPPPPLPPSADDDQGEK